MSWIEKIRSKIPCFLSTRFSFITMTLLLGAFFLLEVVVGYITNSMALIADSFHMLSDVASLIVGYLALQYSSKEVDRETYTYGYARAEVLGALVNAVFLVALCFSITIEALKRLIITEEIENPLLVFCVGAAGLVVNVFGMFLFHQTGHGHTHGGLSHGHSHGEQGHAHSGHDHDHKHGHSHGNQPHKSHHGHSHADISGESGKQYFTESVTLDSVEEKPEHEDMVEQSTEEFELSSEEKLDEQQGKVDHGLSEKLDEQQGKVDNGISEKENIKRSYDEHRHYSNDSSIDVEELENRKYPVRKPASAGHLNIQGVYLHILGDALGSIIVMISALIIIFAKGDWTLYVDPIMSIIMVIIILKTSIPLLTETSKILMNSVPHHIQITDIRERLLKKLPQIKNVHELHVWQLAGDKIIASAHVKFESPEDYDQVAAEIKQFFHDEGIHSTTVQIEFERDNEIDGKRRGPCMVVCSIDSACDEMMCCKPHQQTLEIDESLENHENHENREKEEEENIR